MSGNLGERVSVSVENKRVTVVTRADGGYEHFVSQHGDRLRRVLVAHYGLDIGSEVASDALAWAWEHWERIAGMANPVGYLYRVGQSAARRHHRWQRHLVFPPEETSGEGPLVEPGLDRALASLSTEQRVAVLLVYAFDWSYQDAAEAMSIRVSSLGNHLTRGLARLRRALGEPS
jgi:DNA-directed RNA polymerase specialized sigma24 family protein